MGPAPGKCELVFIIHIRFYFISLSLSPSLTRAQARRASLACRARPGRSSGRSCLRSEGITCLTLLEYIYTRIICICISLSLSLCIYIYIYIYIYDTYIYTHNIYICVYIYIYVSWRVRVSRTPANGNADRIRDCPLRSGGTTCLTLLTTCLTQVFFNRGESCSK